MQTSVQRRWCAIGIAMAAALSACRQPPKPQPEEQPTPKADFTTEQLLTGEVTLARVKAYHEKLRFDDEPGPSDVRHVDLEQPDRRIEKGVLVWIQPEKGSHKLSDAQLSEGRFIAYIWTDYRYPRLGLEQGWNWWWVGAARDTLWSVFVAENTNTKTKKPVTAVRHGRGWYGWKKAIARLVPGTVYTWGTCGGSCCQS